jgi:hypothetical protein
MFPHLFYSIISFHTLVMHWIHRRRRVKFSSFFCMSSFGSVANSVRHAKIKLKLIVVQKVRCVPTNKVTQASTGGGMRVREESWVDLSGGLSNPCKDSLLLLNKPFCRKTHSSPQGDETFEQAKTIIQPDTFDCAFCV